MSKTIDHSHYDCLLWLCLLIGIASPAYGDNSSMLGLSSRASAMGGALTATADDYTATYYNPALLAWTLKDNEWLQTGATFIYTTRDFEVVDTTVAKVKKDFETKGVALGLTMDLDRVAGLKNCSLGTSLYVPTDALLSIDIPTTANEYFFPIYDDLGKGMSAYTGIAYKIGERLSIGVGANFLLRLPDTDTHIIAFVDADELLNNPDLIKDLIEKGELPLGSSVVVQPGVNRELVLKVAPHAGVAMDILDWLRIGLSYRSKIGGLSDGWEYIYITPIDKDGHVVEDLASRLPVTQVPISYYAYFSPREYSFGIGIKRGRFLVDLDITYSMWSGYRGPHKERPPELFKDTWNPKIGLEFYLNHRITLRGGYVWRPSPVPTQRGQTNYLDSDTQILCGGIKYQIGRSSLQAHLQYHLWEDQDVEKGGNLPAIKYKGSLWNTGLSYITEF